MELFLEHTLSFFGYLLEWKCNDFFKGFLNYNWEYMQGAKPLYLCSFQKSSNPQQRLLGIVLQLCGDPCCI